MEIAEYWVVNLKTRQLIIFREPQDGEYASKTTLSEDTINPLVFPDLAVAINSIVSN